jgi:hypothetical protein
MNLSEMKTPQDVAEALVGAALHLQDRAAKESGFTPSPWRGVAMQLFAAADRIIDSDHVYRKDHA